MLWTYSSITLPNNIRNTIVLLGPLHEWEMLWTYYYSVHVISKRSLRCVVYCCGVGALCCRKHVPFYETTDTTRQAMYV